MPDAAAPTRAAPRLAAITVAEAYLALLKRRGVDRLYVNSGTDTSPIIEAYARAAESGLDLPEPVVCAHENLAVGMAHGYYLIARRPQAVMVHVSIGTANALCALMNAARDRVPILMSAGRTPLFEDGRFGARSGWIHWAQEMFDQAGMLRELVKWDYELRDGIQIEAVVDRALSLARAEPCGPVYLSLPREVLAQKIDGLAIANPSLTIPAPPAPDAAAVAEAARLIAAAEMPMIVTGASGQDPQTVPLLAALAERFGIGVVENKSRYVGLPDNHTMHLGHMLEPRLAEADALVFLESDVPWVPRLGAPRPEAHIVQVGVDPMFARYPMRSFRADVSITSTAAAFLAALAAALERLGTDDDRLHRRRERMAKRHAEIRAERAARIAEDEKEGGAITKLWLSHCLDRVRPKGSILVNEYWAIRDAMTFSEPASFFHLSPAGGLGWGFPAALGVQQAAPDRVVIAALGDGAYMFGNPAACHQAAAAYDLPVLAVVCNNARWDAVAGATRRMYPEGAAVRRNAVPLSSLSPSPAFEDYVKASGGYGECVETREALPGALARALDAVRRERRQALLNILCA